MVALLLFVSACGSKKVQVKAPIPAPVSSSELEGLASYYAEPYHGRRTASGEVFDTYQELTAAHRTLPFQTVVRVKNEMNGKEVDVRINDRGPFVDGRVIDLSLRAARELDMVRAGLAPVKLTILQAGEAAQAARVGAYTVQVGAFETLESAEGLKKELEQRQYPAVNIQTVSADKTLYRVRIGPEPDLFSAEKIAATLKKDGFDSFVLRVN
jgi:rare lipoprotein A